MVRSGSLLVPVPEVSSFSRQLQAGTVDVVLCDLGFFKPLGSVNDLEVEFMDQIPQADAKLF